MTKKYISEFLKAFLLFLTLFFCANISVCSEEQEHTQSAQEFQSPLHEAARSGDLSRIRLLLSHGFAVGALDNAQQTALHVAVKNNNLQAIECLVRHGALVNTQDSTGKTPFHSACINGHNGIFTYLFGLGANLIAQDRNRMTPLHYASEKGHTDIVKFFIGTTALQGINHKNSNGYTALHLAAENGHTEVVQCLLQACADIEAYNKDRQTPLHVAASNGHTEVVRCLLRAWKLIEARAADEECSERDDESSDKDCESLDEDDASKGEDDDSSDEDDKSPSQDRRLVNTKDNDGYTPLHLAVMYEHTEVVRCLLQAGADIEARATLLEDPVINDDDEFEGNTALHLACLWGVPTEIIKLLLQQGAYLEARDVSGGGDRGTPLWYAIEHGSLETVRRLIGAGSKTQNIGPYCDEHALHRAAQHNNPEIVEYLLHKTPEGIDAQDYEGNTPLHWAAQWGFVNNVALLVNAGAQVQLNRQGQTPLGFLLDEPEGQEESLFDRLLDTPTESNQNSAYEELIELRPTVKFLVELDMKISQKTKALLDMIYPEHRKWLAERKQFVKTLLEDTLQLPRDIAGLLHEFVFNVKKKRKRDEETPQENNKKSRN